MLKKITDKSKNAIWLLTDTKYKKLASDELAVAVSAANDKHLKLKSNIDLADTWDDEKRTEMEVRIAVIRGKLRYMPESLAMVEKVLDNYKKSDAHNSRLKYFTRVFPMVHPAGEIPLPKKQLIHNDQVGSKRLFTVWTPITQYEYTPLNGYPRYDFITKFCPESLHPFFQQKCEEALEVNMGESVMWGGGYTHAGNANTSKTLSAALVIRLTEEPIIYEPCRLISDGIKDEDKKAYANDMTAEDQIEFCLDLLKKAGLATTENTLEDTFRSAYEFIQERITTLNNELGFCMAVLGQRMRKKTNADFLYACSLLTAPEYLYGLQHFRDKFPSMTSAEFRKILEQYDYMKILPHKSYQIAKLLGNNPSENVKPYTF